ncbi:MAG: S41 family peptidase [Thermonemataceae bacterium]
MKIRSFLKKIMFGVGLLTIVVSCREDDPSPSINDNEDPYVFVYDIMQDVYFWNEEVPENVDIYSYATPFDLLDALIFREDRFTALFANGQEVFELITSGESLDFGFGRKRDEDGILRVAYVYPNTPAAQAGLVRGDKILKVNGTDITNPATGFQLTETTTFEIENIEEEVRSVSITAINIKVDGIVYQEVLEVEGTKVGYLVYEIFLNDEASIAGLLEVFATFKAQGVTEMVLDLRYNGGGSVAASLNLGSHLAPASAMGEVFVRQTFNERYTAENESLLFEEKINNLNLSRLFVITTGSTAAASELIINGLRPFMSVFTIGGQTSGKNVGSFAILNEAIDYLFLPIVFESQNANGNADYANGFTPDFTEIDDLERDFGDPQEASLAAALYYIENGSFPAPAARRGNQLNDSKVIRYRDLQDIPMFIEK